MTTTESFVQDDIIDNEAREVIVSYLGHEERAVRLSSVQVERLTDNGIVRVLRSATSEIARLEALQVRGAAALSRRRGNPRSTEAELSLALRLSPGHAGAVIAAAEALTTRLPRTFELMERGQLDLFRAMKVTDATAWLSDEAARVADAELAPRLPGKNATQVRKAARYAAQQADPEGGNRRTRARLEARGLTLIRQEPGTVTLTLHDAPAEQAVAAYARVDRVAKALKTRDEPRTLDQLRADVALNLLLRGKWRRGAAHRGLPLPGRQRRPGGALRPRADLRRAAAGAAEQPGHGAAPDHHRPDDRPGARPRPQPSPPDGRDGGVRPGP
jgi:hypothetical protein